MTRGDAVEHAVAQLLVVEEMIGQGSSMVEIMLITGIGGDTSAGRRRFLRWLERHERLDLRAYFEGEKP